MQREEKYEQIDKMAERYLADRSDREAIVFLRDAALESDDYRRRIRHIIEDRARSLDKRDDRCDT